MKKSKKTAMIAAAFAVAMGLTSCVPPEEDEFKVRTKDEQEIKNEDPEVVYGPPPDIFDPSTESPTEVYGPPEDFE